MSSTKGSKINLIMFKVKGCAHSQNSSPSDFIKYSEENDNITVDKPTLIIYQ